jgi:invasion protein IalB
MSEITPPPTRTSFVDGLPPIAIHAAIWAGVFIVGALLGWIGRGVLAGPPDVPTMTVYDDWRLICPARKEKDADCRMTHDSVDTKSGQTIVSFALVKELPKEGDKDKKATTVLIANVPLGVLLDPGLGLKFGGDTKTYAYKTCLGSVCAATIPYDEALEKSIEGTSDAAVVVYGPENKPIELPFSTKGFKEARAGFKSFDAKRSSWWWRLWS